MTMRLYSYWRSSASYRVRIALNLKGIKYEYIPIHLLKDGGQQHQHNYTELNPQALVPTLVDGKIIIGQSLAIMEYLDETCPTPPLLPKIPVARAKARQMALAVACEIHPLNNLRVMSYLEQKLGADKDKRRAWYGHWIEQGFAAIEAMVPANASFCVGDQPTLADICLIPQLYNAHRYNVPLEAFPKIQRIEESCLALAPFHDARPEAQPDAET